MLSDFHLAIGAIPNGYSTGQYAGATWAVTVERSRDGRRTKLYGERLGGCDHVSFNLYVVAGEPRLKPCEMPAEKVRAFVLGYIVDRT